MKFTYSASAAPDVKILCKGADVASNPRGSVKVDHGSKSIMLTLKSLKSDDAGQFTIQLSSGGKVCDTASFKLKVQEQKKKEPEPKKEPTPPPPPPEE